MTAIPAGQNVLSSVIVGKRHRVATMTRETAEVNNSNTHLLLFLERRAGSDQLKLSNHLYQYLNTLSYVTVFLAEVCK
jgi:hypothetical protein